MWQSNHLFQLLLMRIVLLLWIFKKLNGIYAINIKLLKCGGILKALAMIQRAHALGLKVMLGCKNESAVGVSAIAQLGGYADFLDLDGHLNIMNDPFM